MTSNRKSYNWSFCYEGPSAAVFALQKVASYYIYYQEKEKVIGYVQFFHARAIPRVRPYWIYPTVWEPVTHAKAVLLWANRQIPKEYNSYGVLNGKPLVPVNASLGVLAAAADAVSASAAYADYLKNYEKKVIGSEVVLSRGAIKAKADLVVAYENSKYLPGLSVADALLLKSKFDADLAELHALHPALSLCD